LTVVVGTDFFQTSCILCPTTHDPRSSQSHEVVLTANILDIHGSFINESNGILRKKGQDSGLSSTRYIDYWIRNEKELELCSIFPDSSVFVSREMTDKIRIVVAILAIICFANLNYQAFQFQLRQVGDEVPPAVLLERFLKTTKRIIVQINSLTECTCGCIGSLMLECPPLYNINDVKESSNVKVSKAINEFMDTAQLQLKRTGLKYCDVISSIPDQSQLSSPMGGYCLNALYKVSGVDRGHVEYPLSNRMVPIPKGFHVANPELLNSLYMFITKENIRSLSDFGAGIGSYGANLEHKFPTLVYRGYDGAPDVEDYTHGYIKYLDLTLPMNLPQSDWVMSLNVGEHIPSTAEGMYLRNLHANNCKGIILSWETPEQPGIGHVNLHTNHYLIEVFQNLGYRFDLGTTREFIEAQHKDSSFRKSLLIFRRTEEIC